MIQAVGANAHEKNLKNLLTKLRTYDIIKLQKDSRSPKNGERVDTMTNRKPTKRDNFNALLAIPDVAGNPQLVEFIEHELELLDKKNSAQRKPTPKQIENEAYRQNILDWMEPDVLYSAADITKGVPIFVENEISSQRVSALLSQLVGGHLLNKTTEKRKNFYSLA